jgi:hypothetical protein
MTNLESLRKHKAYIATCFRRALTAQLEIWNAIGDIEQIVGEIEGMEDLLENLAVGTGRPTEVTALKTGVIFNHVKELMQQPDEECVIS